MFPEGMHTERKEANLSIALLGNRIHCDQTLVEYLIEFLLVFASAKDRSGEANCVFTRKLSCWREKQTIMLMSMQRFVASSSTTTASRKAVL